MGHGSCGLGEVQMTEAEIQDKLDKRLTRPGERGRNAEIRLGSLSIPTA
jgi:hypothetical protein